MASLPTNFDNDPKHITGYVPVITIQPKDIRSMSRIMINRLWHVARLQKIMWMHKLRYVYVKVLVVLGPNSMTLYISNCETYEYTTYSCKNEFNTEMLIEGKPALIEMQG